MKRLYLRIVTPVLAAILGISAVLAVEKSVDVRDLMTANQFHNAGLDTLAAEQLAGLNAVIPAIVRAVDGKQADLRDIMSARQFHNSGLDKLSTDQMATLNAWLNGYLRTQGGVATAPLQATAPQASVAPAPTTSLGASMLHSDMDEPDSIRTNIKGVFLGWTGETAFTLANGQVWKQAEPAVFSTRLQDPEVVIKKLRFGYLLTLPGRGETVFVIRIR